MGRALSSSEALAQVQTFRDAPGWSWLADDVSPAACQICIW
ncbi:hypothetical protein FM104_03420 [Microbacterium esteraromaticum]|uniref:Uncharacterized protein n=1 Tax=Microbacterium esteraromaticum TaxID=57043 RepID=A0A1R4ISH8_9MICO|nr:hypothetical protein FM104_03420 [Microbacterium esteraromaticum]